MARLALSALTLALAACGAAAPPPPAPAASPDPVPAAAPGSASKPAGSSEPAPPIAARHPYAVPSPNGTRDDPYYWLRDDTRKNAAMLQYLADEIAYTAAMLAPAKGTEDAVFGEMRARVAEDDSTAPELDAGYWYYRRYEPGKQSPIFARRKGAMTAPEQILVDGNALGAGHDYFAVGSYQVSPDDKLVAWTDDIVGRREYVLHVRNLATGALLADTVTDVSTAVEWAADSKTLFLVGKDKTTLLENRIVRHHLGGGDEIAYQEADPSFYVGLGHTKSRRYVAIVLGATTMTEDLLIDARAPMAPPVVFLPREKDHLYEMDHLDGRFVIRSNAGAKNFRIVSVAEGKQRDRAAWKEILAHRPDAFVESIALYHGFIAATVRTGGLSKVEVIPNGKPGYFLEAADPTYVMSVIDTPDPGAKSVRYSYSSLVSSASTIEVDVATHQPTLLKQIDVPTYDASQYTSEYLHATAADGTPIPISVVYKKSTPRDGRAPLLVYGYGSYGFSDEPWFNSGVVSLLDRGWVYAIAHVRGGSEMGRAWYDDGHLMHKTNTFTDFIAVTEQLVANKYGARDQVYAHGGSAGGMLMGAIANMRPDLYRAIIADVPFVDVVTTMLDETIPLTTNEFDEWGNPKDKAAYDYMRAYSPYDNVAAKAYPSMFVHTGLWDSQVQYYEPTKWVAKLRATKTDGNLLLLDVDMTSGHGGASGRFDKLRQTARETAFLLLVHDRPDRRAAR